MSRKWILTSVCILILFGAWLAATLSAAMPPAQAQAWTNREAGAQRSSLTSERQGHQAAPLPFSPAAPPHTITYTYDNAGRLVGVDYGGGKTIAYTYDAAGNLLSRAVVAPVTQEITQEITPGAGGSLTYTDPQGSQTIITVPPGAVGQPIDLTFTPLSAPEHPAPGTLTFASHAFGLQVYLGGAEQPGFVFSQPITVTIHYSDAEVTGMDENTLTLDYWDGSSWADAATTCAPVSVYDRHPAENWLAVPICHLSELALFGEVENHIYLPFVVR